jgi:hypothetical protein
MSEVRKLFRCGLYLIISFLLLLFFVNLGFAQEIPHLIRYEKNLSDLLKDKKDGEDEDKKEDKKGKLRDLTFRIYNVETAGMALWEETHIDVPIRQGKFEVLLGSITPLDLKFDEDYWLSIEVNNNGEIEPRERIVSVGYAYMAEDTWKLGGRHFDEYAFTDHSHLGEDIETAVNEAINADMVDGLHAHEIGGVKDHGSLLGLEDDDHLQYLNNERGDIRYAGTEWDGLTKLESVQFHMADNNNPHEVTLAQLNHVDNNPEEEAPTATERGEPTITEIRDWANDIVIWGHGDVVTNLNADKLDGYDSNAFALTSHSHLLQNLTDVSPEEAAAFNAAGAAGASATNRLATMSDLSIGTGAGGWQHDGSLIIGNTPSPYNWTDVDLSPYVGSNRSLVLMKIKNKGNSTHHFLFRTNGETEDYEFNIEANSVNHLTINPNYAATAIVETDDLGMIEWKGQSGVYNEPVDVWLVGYISAGSSGEKGGGQSYRYADMLTGSSDVEVSVQSYTPMPDMTMSHDFSGHPVRISFCAPMYLWTANDHGDVALYIDGAMKTSSYLGTSSGGNVIHANIQWLEVLPAGSHTIEIRWKARDNGTTVRQWGSSHGSRVLIVEEL